MADKKLDALYAYFVVTHMPAGLAGLVIAAFVAAAQSTISSSMNSSPRVCGGFLPPLLGEIEE